MKRLYKIIDLLTGPALKPIDLGAVTILQRARIYLEQYGDGQNNEYIRARHILALAEQRVMSEVQ